MPLGGVVGAARRRIGAGLGDDPEDDAGASDGDDGVGLEDGLLPLHWGEPDETATAEERRLFYVGMTRAKDRLILSRARQRHWRGRPHTLAPSPFLRDIENELVKYQPVQGARAKREDRQLKLF